VYAKALQIGEGIKLPLCRWSAAILFLLHRGAFKPGEICSSLGTTLEIVRMKLRLMKFYGLVQRSSDGRYCLTQSGAQLYSVLEEIFRMGVSPNALYDTLSSKWMKLILIHINKKGMRWKDIISCLKPISPKVLSEKLEKLESFGLVERSVLSTKPPSVLYTVTERGKVLAQWLDNLSMQKS
jgi:DNA-binding HxlR family transcriptional regulator